MFCVRVCMCELGINSNTSLCFLRFFTSNMLNENWKKSAHHFQSFIFTTLTSCDVKTVSLQQKCSFFVFCYLNPIKSPKSNKLGENAIKFVVNAAKCSISMIFYSLNWKVMWIAFTECSNDHAIQSHRFEHCFICCWHWPKLVRLQMWSWTVKKKPIEWVRHSSDRPNWMKLLTFHNETKHSWFVNTRRKMFHFQSASLFCWHIHIA